MQRGKSNVRLPRIGALIKVIPKGFSQPFIGRFERFENNNTIVLDIDPRNWLPEEMKIVRISILDEYVVL